MAVDDEEKEKNELDLEANLERVEEENTTPVEESA